MCMPSEGPRIGAGAIATSRRDVADHRGLQGVRAEQSFDHVRETATFSTVVPRGACLIAAVALAMYAAIGLPVVTFS